MLRRIRNCNCKSSIYNPKELAFIRFLPSSFPSRYLVLLPHPLTSSHSCLLPSSSPRLLFWRLNYLEPGQSGLGLWSIIIGNRTLSLGSGCILLGFNGRSVQLLGFFMIGSFWEAQKGFTMRFTKCFAIIKGQSDTLKRRKHEFYELFCSGSCTCILPYVVYELFTSLQIQVGSEELRMRRVHREASTLRCMGTSTRSRFSETSVNGSIYAYL